MSLFSLDSHRLSGWSCKMVNISNISWIIFFLFINHFFFEKKDYTGVLFNISATVGSLKDNPAEKLQDLDGRVRVFDRNCNEWKKTKIEDIPITYSYVPKPTNYRMEARLWLETAHILRHQYIWSRPDIGRNLFEKMASASNVHNFDRYVLFTGFTGFDGNKLVHKMDRTNRKHGKHRKYRKWCFPNNACRTNFIKYPLNSARF